MRVLIALAVALLYATSATAQDTFTALIPPSLLTRNYGSMPNDIVGFDLTICNATDQKQSVISSQVYHARAASTGQIMPVGSQILRASILCTEHTRYVRAEHGSWSFLFNESSKKVNPPAGAKTGVRLAALSPQQFSNNFKSVLSADKLQKFEVFVYRVGSPRRCSLASRTSGYT
jgi:hypothetical protein